MDFVVVSCIDLQVGYFFSGSHSLISLFCGVLYFTFFTASKWQATVGQRLMSIYVKSNSCKKISLVLAMDRYIAQLFLPILGVLVLSLVLQYPDLFLLWVLLMIGINFCVLYWYLVAFKDRQRRTLHDRIFNTVVVDGRCG